MKAKFIYESLSDVLKPKTQEEIDKNLSEIFDINSVREHIRKYSMGKLLCVYVYDTDWNMNFYSNNVNNIIKNLTDYVIKSYKYELKRTIVVYKIDGEGKFSDESNLYCDGNVKILLELNIDESHGEYDDEKHYIVNLELWNP